MRAELEKIRDWADAKLASGQEPPWAWFQYMKLRETLDQILAGMNSVTSLPQSASPAGGHIRIVASTDRQDSVQRRHADARIPLPM